MTRRHVITGGSGFTGTQLAQLLLEQDARVTIFDLVQPQMPSQPNFQYLHGDVTKSEDLAKLNLDPNDVVYHLAARQFSGRVPNLARDHWFAEVNVDGTARLLAAMKEGGANKMVFFSTDMTYGKPDKTPVLATHPQRPFGPYGRSKLAAELLIVNEIAAGDLQATIFRPRLIAGAGRLGILAKLFWLVERGAPLPMIGAGTNRYQMIAVEDCAKAALKAVQLGLPTGPFNLGSDDPPTVRQLLTELAERAGSASRPFGTPTRLIRAVLHLADTLGMTILFPEQFLIANEDYLLDTSGTRSALGWSPTRRDEDILFEAFEEFRDRRHRSSR